MRYKVLFLGRKNDHFSDKMIRFLKKKKNINSTVMLSKSFNQKLYPNKIFKKKFDFVFSFRNHSILGENFIKKTNFFCINFHPGPPEYRGVGCVNFALYDGVRKYGLTAHLINKKLDSGKILDVKRFIILKKDNVDRLLKKTYKLQVLQFKKIVTVLFKNPKNIEKLIKKNNKENWSKKITTRKKLNKFYEIKKNTSKKKFLSKIRATDTKLFKPYIMMFGKFFYLASKYK